MSNATIITESFSTSTFIPVKIGRISSLAHAKIVLSTIEANCSPCKVNNVSISDDSNRGKSSTSLVVNSASPDLDETFSTPFPFLMVTLSVLEIVLIY